MTQQILRYKYELFPSPSQEVWLNRIFGVVRLIYNEMLDACQNHEGLGRLSRNEMQTLLTVYREAIDWVKKAPSQSLQVVTHDLDVAYQNFYSGQNGHPQYKKRTKRQSFQLPQPKLKTIDGQHFIFLPNYKVWIPYKMHREIPSGSKIGSATITKVPCGRYYVSFVVTLPYVKHELVSKDSKTMVGVDINIHEFVFSNGRRVEIPQKIKNLERKMKLIQKSMQRQFEKKCQTFDASYSGPKLTKDERRDKIREIPHSKNYDKNRIKLNFIYEKLKFQKEDFLRKLAISIYKDNQFVALETLNVRGMVRNRRLARSIAQQSWGKFISFMKFYAVKFQKSLHFIDRWFPSSKMCHQCGFVNSELKLSDREWTCESCKCVHNRDGNAAKNIASEGGSYPAYMPVERKRSVRRPKGLRATEYSLKQESSGKNVAA